jgi:asparagine synthase (glutamine-hydrolysing)
MCGISGSTQDPTGRTVAVMTARLHHRGPDDDGLHVDPDGIALGVRRLSIIDLENGHQPMSSEDGSIWVAFNGEIYNHARLRTQLQQRGHTFRTRADTEVLVHLWEEYGPELVHSLEGMFAFAIWDARQGRLMLARDRFGEKPLFYTHTGGTLRFASELTALMAGGDVEMDFDPEALDAFLVFGYVPSPATMIRGVAQIEPGQLLLWDRDSRDVELRRYWSPSSPPERFDEPVDELVAETRRLLETSIRERLVADVPVGVFLSGGVDSTLVTTIAARLSTRPVKTFTVDYDVGNVGETEKARTVAHRLGTEHNELELRTADVARLVPNLLASLDQPLADQALVPLHAVSKLARQDVTVVVGGEGADELFGGYPRYRWLSRVDQVERHVALSSLNRLVRLDELPLGRRGRTFARIVAEGDLAQRHVDWVTSGRRGARSQLYGPRLARQVDLDRLLRDAALRINGAGSTAVGGELMRYDQSQWLPDDVLVKADRASMLVGLEMRTPYLQRDLAEFAMSIPAATHLRGRGKVLLRRLLGEYEPRLSRSRRPKTAFRVPASDWLRGPLAATLEDQLRAGSVYEHGWLDRSTAQALVAEHRDGRDRTEILWPMLALGLWMDRMVGRDE